ncbi:MAG: L,D-transpeptidase family protein [Candidatus Brocadiia bacterium]
MRKIIVLIIAAAAVGIVILRTGETDRDISSEDSKPVKSDTASGESPPSRLALRADRTFGQEGQQSADEESSSGKTSAGAVKDSTDEGQRVARAEKRSPKADSSHASKEKGASGVAKSELPSFAASTPSKINPHSPSEEKPTRRTDSEPVRRARELLEEGNKVEARRVLTDIYLNGSPAAREIAHRCLRKINEELVFNPRNIDGAKIHVVKAGDTLGKIGRKYGVNWRMIRRINGLSRGGMIRLNQQLKILTGDCEILVDKSDYRLTLFIDGVFIKQYPVGLGKNDRTPTAEFTIDDMLVEPDWYPPGGGVIEYGEKGHLIGERWLGLCDKPGAAGLGIHGTNEPESIGKMCSNGCIRMLNKDVKELYDLVKVGTKVKIVE